MIVAACGGGGQSPPVAATAASGALAVTVAGPAGAVAPGDTLMLTVSARDAQARGALAYRVAYGDATTDQNAVPQFCLAGPGAPQTASWRLTHRYATGGSFRVSVTVTANCTPDHVTAELSITVR